jgi:hypothetical protein
MFKNDQWPKIFAVFAFWNVVVVCAVLYGYKKIEFNNSSEQLLADCINQAKAEYKHKENILCRPSPPSLTKAGTRDCTLFESVLKSEREQMDARFLICAKTFTGGT